MDEYEDSDYEDDSVDEEDWLSSSESEEEESSGSESVDQEGIGRGERESDWVSESENGSENEELDVGNKAKMEIEVRGRDVKTVGTWQDEVDATDTSDEEEVRNTLGNIPLEWYDDYEHIGYNQEGHRILKPASAHTDKVRGDVVVL